MPAASSRRSRKSGGSNSESQLKTIFGAMTARWKPAVGAASWIAVIAAGALGWIYGVPALQAKASVTLVTDSVDVELPPLPGWLRPVALGENEKNGPQESVKRAILREMSDAVRDHVSRDPLDRSSLVSARQALLDTGWFQSVNRISRPLNNLIVVEGAYVEPFTLVEDSDGSHLIDRSGILLPYSYQRSAPLRAIPSIVGAHFARPAQPGRVWEGTDVAAGLKLASILEGHEWTQQILSIDVSDFSQSETLWLHTDKGARIMWGRVPGEERGREVPASQKLEYLNAFYEDSGRVDRHYSELDLALDVVHAQ